MPSLAVVLRLRARELSGPAAILKDLDEALKQITDVATFVTMFYARFDRAARTVEYASGGHNPPLLLRPKTGETLMLAEAGPILGILPNAQFSNTIVALESSDILTLFTDGVTEQENQEGEEFSIDRLKDVVLRVKAEPAAVVVANVVEAVSTFAGSKEQADDLTAVVVKIQ
jgi:sigma-B regulation protein RsbU (phosphoserine phosphatase)